MQLAEVESEDNFFESDDDALSLEGGKERPEEDDWILSFDVVTTPKYSSCLDSDAFKYSVLLLIGNDYKKYKWTTTAPQISRLSQNQLIAASIQENEFIVLMTPDQISGKLRSETSCKEFMRIYIEIVNKLITANFVGEITVYSKSNSTSDTILDARQIILNSIQCDREFAQYKPSKTSPNKLSQSEFQSVNHSVFVPKITASILISIESLEESLSPKTDDPPRFVSPREKNSPRRVTSPIIIVNDIGAQQSSPREKSSPRLLSLTRQKSGSGFLTFFKKLGSDTFTAKPQLKPSPRNGEAGDSPNYLLKRRISAANCREAAGDQFSNMPLSVRPSISVRARSFSGVPNDDAVTEIQFSPRDRSSSSPRSPISSDRPTENGSFRDILMYSMDIITQWCRDNSYTLVKLKKEIIIEITKVDAIRVYGHYIQANNVNTETISIMINLIHRLTFAVNVSITHESTDPAVNETIIAGILKTPTPSTLEDSRQEIRGPL